MEDGLGFTVRVLTVFRRSAKRADSKAATDTRRNGRFSKRWTQ